jgi:hypothetical protein
MAGETFEGRRVSLLILFWKGVSDIQIHSFRSIQPTTQFAQDGYDGSSCQADALLQ